MGLKATITTYRHHYIFKCLYIIKDLEILSAETLAYLTDQYNIKDYAFNSIIDLERLQFIIDIDNFSLLYVDENWEEKIEP